MSLALGLLIGVVLLNLVYEGKFGKAIAVIISALFGWVLVWETMAVSSCVFNPLHKPLPLLGRQVMLHCLTFNGLIAMPISVIFAFALKPHLPQLLDFSVFAMSLIFAGLIVLSGLAISAISVLNFGTNAKISLLACSVALCFGLVLLLALQGHEWA